MHFTSITTQFLTLLSGEKVFWREAGHSTSPTILLLHGFPTSSVQYRYLMPLLAPKYRVIAPDFPGFGFTEVSSNYTYTFDNLFGTVDSFLEQMPNPPSKYSIYIFDYGAPVGLRLALKHPEKIQAIITQNGNAYDEGLGEFWDAARALWANDTAETRAAIQYLFTFDTTKLQYEMGVKDTSKVDPASYWLDQVLMDRPGNKEIQTSLFKDYQSNVKLYPKWQEYFRKSQVPALVCWGKEDFIFIPPGAEAFKRDLPKAQISFLDTGHFASVNKAEEIAGLMVEFLGKNGIH